MKLTSKRELLRSATALGLEVCGLRGARFENRNQFRELGISNPEFVDGTVHVGGAERHILEATLERVVVTNRRPVDAQS